ncbi:undecaprenyl-diphosphate phosphatase [Granulicella sibirica]|uniref:Undecaprenyl-diphosphatase n=1 Tax=Granulicella sibirica TaxID=2479048 RepID=A0A4Q0SZD7_9BACT|nr:undecaprenyl-diphosphate phosphatase [Granulicella sibirica]RXH54998.1 Undecaprenyl-diphosphatase [Granulicella sibirica]
MGNMPIQLIQVILLAIVQGLAELLPVSSSAHVVVAEKLMHLDPSTPEMTLLLVMLHTGTMFAVIVYFWKRWQKTYFSSAAAFKGFLVPLVAATALTVIIGYPLQKVVAKVAMPGAEKAEIEELFKRLDIIAPALFAAGVLILIAGLRERRQISEAAAEDEGATLTMPQSLWIGAIQGICIPFRGFSRSGATISTGMLAGAAREKAERFSFALAVVLTPPVVFVEVHRLLKATKEAAAAGTPIDLHATLMMSLLGAVFAFLAGLVALKWLSSWLESGKWYLFGIYCLVASGVVFYLHTQGY